MGAMVAGRSSAGRAARAPTALAGPAVTAATAAPQATAAMVATAISASTVVSAAAAATAVAPARVGPRGTAEVAAAVPSPTTARRALPQIPAATEDTAV